MENFTHPDFIKTCEYCSKEIANKDSHEECMKYATWDWDWPKCDYRTICKKCGEEHLQEWKEFYNKTHKELYDEDMGKN